MGSAGGRARPRARLLPGLAEAALRDAVGWVATATEESGEEGEAVKAEPVGRGEPTARGVGAEGCGAQARIRVGPGFGDGAGVRLGPGVEDAGAEFRAAGGSGVGLRGSRSMKRAVKRFGRSVLMGFLQK